MGKLVNGVWVTENATPGKMVEGKFEREPTVFRNWISRDGSTGFPADPHRYHLYVAHVCPWAHRALIMKNLRGLEMIQVSVVDPVLNDEDGWKFTEYPGSTSDKVFGFTHLRQVYLKSEPLCTARVTVPVLFDVVQQKIVNNESSEIIVMINECFDGFDYYPIELKPAIDEVNSWIYDKINNGVYKCGFATTQEAYNQAVVDLFSALDRAESILSSSRYLCGSSVTLADIRLFTTLIRFDVAYFSIFKCNIRQIRDYPNLWNYLKDLYSLPHFGETVNIDHIKRGYFMGLSYINPSKVIPKGPEINFSETHDREIRFPSTSLQ